MNESNTLEELDLFIPMLKLMERQGNQDEKLLNAEISNLIGRRLHDFDIMGPEVCYILCASFDTITIILYITSLTTRLYILASILIYNSYPVHNFPLFCRTGAGLSS